MNNLCADIGWKSINHEGEQLCGDHVDIVEQNDNNFDGIINNTPQTPTVGELEQKVKAGEPISLIDLANAIHADKESGKEEKPSIRAQLRAAKEQTAQRKAQRSKTRDLERI